MGIIAHNTTARPQRTLNTEEAVQISAILRSAGLLP